jgi:hypothetical protein
MIRQPRYRWARQEAQGPDRDPLLDARRVLVLAQKISRDMVNGRPQDDQEAGVNEASGASDDR